MSANILIVDDEPTLSLFLARSLDREGFQTRRAFSIEEAWESLKALPTDLLILDLKLPDGFGIEIMQRMQQSFVDPPPTLIITGHADANSAVAAMRLQAFDYLEKPLRTKDIRSKVRQALASRAVSARIRQEGSPVSMVIGESPAYQETLKMVERVAPTDANIFISGESGSGKELIARLIHERSPRAKRGKFIAVNCATIPSDLLEAELFGVERGAYTDAKQPRPGQIELADGGTLFLDEVDQLSLDAQGKLLRVIEERKLRRLGGTVEKPVDFRLLTATNVDLNARIEESLFRHDLHYRIYVIDIHVPPLRERRQDLERFVAYFVRLYNKENDREIELVDPEVMAIFERYDWPGNIRELSNVIQRAVILAEGDRISLRHLPRELQEIALPGLSRTSTSAAATPTDRYDLKAEVADLEKRMVLLALRRFEGNQSQAARFLNLSRDQLRYKIRKYDIDSSEFVEEEDEPHARDYIPSEGAL